MIAFQVNTVDVTVPHLRQTLHSACPICDISDSVANFPIKSTIPCTSVSSHCLLSCLERPFEIINHGCTYKKVKHIKHTFAISLQLFPASRISFKSFSSPGVHGVFVRPRFLPVSSLNNAGIERFALDSDGKVVPGGKVSSLGLRDRCRFRGFGDVTGGTVD